MPAQVAHVLYCVEVNTSTQECVQTAWLPAPSLLPPLSMVETLTLMSLITYCMAASYAPRVLGRAVRGR